VGTYILRISTIRQKIFIESPGFLRKTIDIPVLQPRTVLHYKVEELKPGILQIESYPSDAEIFINDISKGVTPFEGTLKQGTYEVRLLKDMYHDLIQTIEVLPDTVQPYSFNLDPKFGSLTITSQPEGAEIFIDNSKRGEAPVYIEKILSGEHNLLARLKPYGDVRKSIVIKDGQETIDHILMKKTQSALLLEEQQTWKTLRTWSLIGTGVFAATGLGLKFLADSKFDEYEKATTTKDATKLRSQVENLDLYTLIAYGITGAFAGWTVFNHFKIPDAAVSLSVNKNETKIVASLAF